jgi:hypothetical protein
MVPSAYPQAVLALLRNAGIQRSTRLLSAASVGA